MANKIKIFLQASVLILLSTGCTSELDPENYYSYYEKNKADLKRDREFDQLKFEISYIPTDVMAVREMNETAGNFDRKQFLENYKNYRGSYYFSFKIHPANDGASLKKIIQTKENYSRIKQHLASEIQNDFVLEFGSKKVNCSLIHVEPDLGIQDAILFIMSFEKPADQELLTNDMTLVYNDQVFHYGRMKFHYPKDLINDFPKLKAI